MMCQVLDKKREAIAPLFYFIAGILTRCFATNRTQSYAAQTLQSQKARAPQSSDHYWRWAETHPTPELNLKQTRVA
jgi:hypothetical protein